MAVIAADIGGTKLLLSVVKDSGAIVGRVKKSTPKTADELVNALVELITEAISRSDEKVKGIGIALAGLVEYKTGLVISSPNLPLSGLNLRELMRDKINLPIFIDNDANLAALGENILGSGRNWDDFVALTLGTGIGGGIIIGGEIYRGYLGTAAEIGHMVIAAGGEVCNCGRQGCFEAMASGTAVSRMALAAKAGNPDSKLSHEIDSHKDKAPSVIVGELARQDDKDAQAIFKEMGWYLGIGLGNLVNIFSPQGIILGGGLSQIADLFLPAARESLLATSIDPRAGRVEVKVSTMGYDAGLIGAAAMAEISGA